MKTILALALALALTLVCANLAAAANPNFGVVGGPRIQTPLPPLRAPEITDRGIVTPAEFTPASELQMSAQTFGRMAHALIKTVDEQATIVVLAGSNSEKQSLLNKYQQLGGDPKRVRVWIAPYNSIWYQDYGPIYSRDADGKLVSNDFVYDRFGRTDDDQVPARLAAIDGIRNNKVNMYYEGGNFIADGEGNCFASTRMYEQNPGTPKATIDAVMKANLGCQAMVTMPPLKEDDTYHIDLFAKLVAPKTFFVADMVNDSTNQTIMNANTKMLEASGYRVVRIPVRHEGGYNYLSHINSFIINGYVLMPEYGIAEDRAAKAAYEAEGFKVIGIPASDLQNTGGAIHCILRSKPR